MDDIWSIYNQLLERNKDLMVLQTAESIIHWDMETMMPPKAVEQRSQQLALLSRIHHKMGTDPEIGKLLHIIEVNPEYQELGQVEKRNIYLIKKTYDEQTHLPEKLVSELAKQEAITVNTWKKAKAQKNFNLLKPELKKIFDLNKQAAEILMKVKQTKTSYEALIDNFEPKMTTQTITSTFNQLQKGLRPLLNKIMDCQTKPATDVLSQPVPVESQRQIAQLATKILGYDTASATACGRIDETEHPFTTGCYDDVRITTHYHQNNYASSIFSVLHETGHAIYEQNLRPEWKYQPVGTTCSYGIHESQSRFYENIVGRSIDFWTYFLLQIKNIAKPLSSVELDSFIQAVNIVQPSKIRIEADEVTYSLHIIIRFEIERDLFAGKIEVSELPQIWNQKYAEYLELNIENDSEGVMQDTHWASGLYGYFPSYALGNIYGGQITAMLTKQLPNWRNQLSKGNLKEINAWLCREIHSQGNLYDPEELMARVTGQKLDSQAYLKYLEEKYSQLYDF